MKKIGLVLAMVLATAHGAAAQKWQSDADGAYADSEDGNSQLVVTCNGDGEWVVFEVVNATFLPAEYESVFIVDGEETMMDGEAMGGGPFNVFYSVSSSGRLIAKLREATQSVTKRDFMGTTRYPVDGYVAEVAKVACPESGEER